MRYDVAVVGAGPAGSAAALRLARAGIGVCVIERSQFPRTKACGEYLSAGALRCLGALGVADRLARDAAVLHGVRLFGSGTRAELHFSAPAWSLPRATLDAAILEAAIDAGASHMLGRAEHFERSSDGMRIDVRTPAGNVQRVDARVLVGADGAQSLVAREFGLTEPVKGHRRFALGGHYAGLSGLDAHLEMFVEGRSYFAINPMTDTRANVMLIVDEADLYARRDDVESFMLERALALSGGRIRFAGASLEGKRIAIGPLAHRTRRHSVPQVLLTGDSAQFLDPFTGQGVYLALRAAQLASHAIVAHFLGRASEESAWREYESRLRAELRSRRLLSAIVSLLIREPRIARRAAVLAQRTPRIFRPLIDAVTGAA